MVRLDLSKEVYGLLNGNMKDPQIIGLSNRREEYDSYVKLNKKYSVWRLVLISGEVPEPLSSRKE